MPFIHVYNWKLFLTIMSFWASAPKSPTGKGISKKSLDTSLYSIKWMFFFVIILFISTNENIGNDGIENDNQGDFHLQVLY